jgi:hypothetical protein
MPSTVIAHARYDADKQILTVVFVSGLVYKYLKVPQNVYDAFRSSGSKGAYLNKFIKGHYEYEKEAD